MIGLVELTWSSRRNDMWQMQRCGFRRGSVPNARAAAWALWCRGAGSTAQLSPRKAARLDKELLTVWKRFLVNECVIISI